MVEKYNVFTCPECGIVIRKGVYEDGQVLICFNGHKRTVMDAEYNKSLVVWNGSVQSK
jgi:hypothetical protein